MLLFLTKFCKIIVFSILVIQIDNKLYCCSNWSMKYTGIIKKQIGKRRRILLPFLIYYYTQGKGRVIFHHCASFLLGWLWLLVPYLILIFHGCLEGGFLKTHDFLQPLDQASKTVGKEENKIELEATEKLPSSAEHILPGGIGTYSISYLQQRVPKPEANIFAVTQASSTDRNSNCSSYSGSGFTLWNESATKRGKTGKENLAGDRHVVRGIFSFLGFNILHVFLESFFR